MRKLFTADIHLSLYSNDRLIEGIPERLHSAFHVLEQMAMYAKANGIKVIEIAGDLFNDKSLLHTRPFVMLTAYFHKWKELDFVLMSGNHDLDTTADDQISIISGFESVPNVACIVNPYIFDNITYIPYTKNIAQDIEEAEGGDILISHFGLNEAQIVPGMSLTSNIKMSDLKKWKMVLLGHYHLPQDIDGKGTMVYYTGSPYQKDWNEKHQKKRFLVYDSKTLKVESILTDGYRKYIELIIDNSNKENAKDILAEAKQQRADGNHVRVRNKTEEVIDEDDVFVISEKEIDITNRGVEITMSTADKLRKYAEIKEIPATEMAEYLKMGIELCQIKQI